MKHRQMKQRAVWAIFAAQFALGCGGNGSKGPSTPVGPSGEVKLTVTKFFNNDGESFSRGDASEVVLGCDGAINLDFTVDNWLLRPPDTCGSFVQCGYVELLVDPSSDDARTVTSATTSLAVTDIAAGR